MTWNMILFSVFPYLASAIAVGGGIYRYVKDRRSYSSFSSQFLENRMLFWGNIIFHYSIIAILLAHLWGGLFRAWAVAWTNAPASLFILELSGYILGYAALAGLAILLFRRLVNPKMRKQTPFFDWTLLLALMVQIALGVHIAHAYRWGSVWYSHTASSWFYSLLFLNPHPGALVDLPWPVKAHAFTAFVIILLFPFTMLAHVVTVPVAYLWRPFQVVIWNTRKGWRIVAWPKLAGGLPLTRPHLYPIALIARTLTFLRSLKGPRKIFTRGPLHLLYPRRRANQDSGMKIR